LNIRGVSSKVNASCARRRRGDARAPARRRRGAARARRSTLRIQSRASHLPAAARAPHRRGSKAARRRAYRRTDRGTSGNVFRKKYPVRQSVFRFRKVMRDGGLEQVLRQATLECADSKVASSRRRQGCGRPAPPSGSSSSSPDTLTPPRRPNTAAARPPDSRPCLWATRAWSSRTTPQ
jgi:hypothetical protein